VSGRGSVLVVDDDRALALLVAELATRAGCEALIAGDAEAATSLVEEGGVDVVVTDVRLPGVDGIELCAWLRKHHPRTPVLVVTAFGSTDAEVRAIRAGAFDYLQKPFDPRVLIRAIERALTERRTRVDLASQPEEARSPR
jgi:DNA-binding response OmpR family regulator